MTTQTEQANTVTQEDYKTEVARNMAIIDSCYDTAFQLFTRSELVIGDVPSKNELNQLLDAELVVIKPGSEERIYSLNWSGVDAFIKSYSGKVSQPGFSGARIDGFVVMFAELLGGGKYDGPIIGCLNPENTQQVMDMADKKIIEINHDGEYDYGTVKVNLSDAETVILRPSDYVLIIDGILKVFKLPE